MTKPSVTEGNATSVPLGGLFAAPVAEPGFCFVCEHFRSRPLGCGPQCMEDDYPQEPTE